MTEPRTRRGVPRRESPRSSGTGRGPDYAVRVFTEAEDPEAARAARRIHAESYLFAGFVRPIALTTDGTLCQELDPATGEGVTYFVAERRGGAACPPDIATARLVQGAAGGDFHDLKAYRFSARALRPAARELLAQHSREHGPGSVREVAALARSLRGTPWSSLALLRALARYGAAQDPPQLWLAVVVPGSLAALQATLGDAVIRRAGGTIPGYPGNPRVSPGLEFVPALIDSAHILESMAGCAMSAPTVERRALLQQTLQYFVTDLPPGARSAAVGACLQPSP